MKHKIANVNFLTSRNYEAVDTFVEKKDLHVYLSSNKDQVFFHDANYSLLGSI